MSICSYSSIVLSSLIVAGCATNHFDRNTKFSNSGTLYTESVNVLLQKTKTRLIDVNTELLLISPRETAEGRRAAIVEQTRSLAELLDKIDDFLGHNRLLGRYFTELKTVSETASTTSIGTTLGEISSTIANLNKKTVDEFGAETLHGMSNYKKEHSSTVADHLVKTHFAKRIQRQLRRDSKIIETQLYLQSKQLDKLIELMRDTIEEGNILYLNQKVIRPYANKIDPRNLAEWKKARAQWFNLRRTEPVFEDVKEAQQAMLWAWRDIVQGKRDISSVNNTLKDTNEFIRAVSTLKATPDRSSNTILIQ